MTAGGDMSFRCRAFLTAVAILGAASNWAVAGTVHHDLEVRLEPDLKSLQVVDRVSFVDAVAIDGTGAYRFVLHAGLEPRVVTPGWRLQPQEGTVEAWQPWTGVLQRVFAATVLLWLFLLALRLFQTSQLDGKAARSPS